MIDEDLTIFTQGDFSEVAEIDGVEVSGIFDQYHEVMSGIGQTSSLLSEGQKYSFKAERLKLLSFGHGSSLTLKASSRRFEVIEKQLCPPDGKLTNLILKEV